MTKIQKCAIVLLYYNLFVIGVQFLIENIDIERTIKELGYDPKNLSRGSNRKVYSFCTSCMDCNLRRFADLFRKDIVLCRKCSYLLKGKLLVISNKGKTNSKESNEKRRIKSLGRKQSKETIAKRVLKLKGYKHSEETKRKISEKAIGRLVSEETRKKLSEAGKGKLTGKSNPRYGKPPPHGKGVWYTKKDGSKVWMRSSWEVKYAEYLDNLKIDWDFESRAYPIIYEYKGEKKEGNYWPDFRVSGEWIEVKGYWRDDAKPKFEAFKEQYPDEKITLLMKSDLLGLGIDVK